MGREGALELCWMVTGEPAVWSDIELVELHDGVVERLEITREGNVRIELPHLAAESLEDVDLVTVDGRPLDPTLLVDRRGVRVDHPEQSQSFVAGRSP